MKRLDLVVGPNGAGKSTFVELTLAPLLPGSAFVNADEIARQRMCPRTRFANATDVFGGLSPPRSADAIRQPCTTTAGSKDPASSRR
jgi:ATPase subunit of ABC transporter with duplicated ATPase domains